MYTYAVYAATIWDGSADQHFHSQHRLESGTTIDPPPQTPTNATDQGVLEPGHIEMEACQKACQKATERKSHDSARSTVSTV
jgi:hypothetical protein